jgi:hypothetical protein
MTPDRPAQLTLDPDPGVGTPSLDELLAHALEEQQDVPRGHRLIHPRQPLPQIAAVPFHHAEQRVRIARVELPQLDSRRGRQLPAHVPAGACGLRDLAIAGSSGVSG